jgi:hypothetical protein
MPAPSYDLFVPKFKLYDSTGTTLLFTFPACQNTNLPQNPQDTVTITNLRSAGAVVINGGTKPFEAFIEFWIFGDAQYTDVINAIDTLYSTITINTPFLLRVDKDASHVYEYKVKRIVDFEWQNIQVDLRQNRQEVTIKFLANSW